MTVLIRIASEPFDPEAEGAALRDCSQGAGAFVTFVGQVRSEASALLLEHYPSLTEREIRRFADEATARWPLAAVRIVHRVGRLSPGEPLVFVGAAAAHRREAFEAADFLMDYLKSEAPFWKRETKGSETRWIEPRAEDRSDLMRWKERSAVYGIREDLPFTPVRVAVLTVSDTRTPETDTSGDALAARLAGAGHVLADRALVPDDRTRIRGKVDGWIADPAIDVVITTGGTGLTGRDVTVEALRPLFEKEIEGFSVLFHQISFRTVGLSTLQSRACAGLARGKFLFLLPGSTGAVKDAWDEIIRFEIDSRYRPCNLVELMPRLLEK